MSISRNAFAKPVNLHDRILRWPEVQERVGLCRSHVHQLISKGQFPAQIRLTANGRASGWLESEIEAWLENRIAQSRLNSEAV